MICQISFHLMTTTLQRNAIKYITGRLHFRIEHFKSLVLGILSTLVCKREYEEKMLTPKYQSTHKKADNKE